MWNPTQTPEPPWTLLKLLKWTTEYFKSRDIEDPRASAEILLAHAFHLGRIDLYLRYDQPMSAEELQRFKPLVKRRVQREPVAYIVGEKEFWSLSFAVSPDVLIPRPETESLVEAALALIPSDGSGERRIFEPGTGSGAVIIALAKERPGSLFFASDRSLRALSLARQNAGRHGLVPSIRFFAGDWFDACRRNREGFDLIVSNPPYIPSGVIPGLQPEVSRFEPRISLDGGTDGLRAIRHLIQEAPLHLKPGGGLLLEIGHDQKTPIAEIADRCGSYARIDFFNDFSGWVRGVRLLRKG
jgi:release factor glutamine methyltransferase